MASSRSRPKTNIPERKAQDIRDIWKVSEPFFKPLPSPQDIESMVGRINQEPKPYGFEELHKIYQKMKKRSNEYKALIPIPIYLRTPSQTQEYPPLHLLLNALVTIPSDNIPKNKDIANMNLVFQEDSKNQLFLSTPSSLLINNHPYQQLSIEERLEVELKGLGLEDDENSDDNFNDIKSMLQEYQKQKVELLELVSELKTNIYQHQN